MEKRRKDESKREGSRFGNECITVTGGLATVTTESSSENRVNESSQRPMCGTTEGRPFKVLDVNKTHNDA